MRLTDQTRKVLLAMARKLGDPTYGLELTRDLGLKSGTLYPILARLEANYLIDSGWEKIDPTEAGRPARRYYRLTAAGLRTVDQIHREMLNELDGLPSLALLPRRALA
jgi:PadR family transcriptional regulator PadR